MAFNDLDGMVCEQVDDAGPAYAEPHELRRRGHRAVVRHGRSFLMNPSSRAETSSSSDRKE